MADWWATLQLPSCPSPPPQRLPQAATVTHPPPPPRHDSGTGPYTHRANTSVCLLSPRAQSLFHSKPSADVPHVTSLCLQGYCRSTQVDVATLPPAQLLDAQSPLFSRGAARRKPTSGAPASNPASSLAQAHPPP